MRRESTTFYELKGTMLSTEGIILRTTSFEEKSFISHVFTRECGVIAVIKKMKNEQKGFTPLVKVELIVKPSQKELWSAKEAIIVTSFPKLRSSLKTLELASLMLRALLTSLPLHEPLPELYAHFDKTLFLLGEALHPDLVAGSFFVTLLDMEGLLSDAQKQKWQEITQKNGIGDEATLDAFIAYIKRKYTFSEKWNAKEGT